MTTKKHIKFNTLHNRTSNVAGNVIELFARIQFQRNKNIKERIFNRMRKVHK